MFCFGFLGGRSIIIAALKILLPSDGIDMFYAQRYIFVLFSFLIFYIDLNLFSNLWGNKTEQAAYAEFDLYIEHST